MTHKGKRNAELLWRQGDGERLRAGRTRRTADEVGTLSLKQQVNKKRMIYVLRRWMQWREVHLWAPVGDTAYPKDQIDRKHEEPRKRDRVSLRKGLFIRKSANERDLRRGGRPSHMRHPTYEWAQQ